MQSELDIKCLSPHYYFSNFGRVKLIFKANFRAKKGVLMGKRDSRGHVLAWEVEIKGVKGIRRWVGERRLVILEKGAKKNP